MKYLLYLLLFISTTIIAQNEHFGKWKYESIDKSSIDTIYISSENLPNYYKSLESRLSGIRIFFVNDSIVDYQIDQLFENQPYNRAGNFISIDEEMELELLSNDRARLDMDLASIYMVKYADLIDYDKKYLIKEDYQITPIDSLDIIGQWVVVDVGSKLNNQLQGQVIQIFKAIKFSFKESGNAIMEFAGNEMPNTYSIEPETNVLVTETKSGKTDRSFVILELTAKHMILESTKRNLLIYLLKT